MMSQSSITIGVSLGTLCIFALTLNITVLYVLCARGFLKRNNRYAPIYIMVAGTIINDMIQQILVICYSTPSFVFQVKKVCSFICTVWHKVMIVKVFIFLFQDFLYDKNDESSLLKHVILDLTLFVWYCNCMFQIVIALNRWVIYRIIVCTSESCPCKIIF